MSIDAWLAAALLAVAVAAATLIGRARGAHRLRELSQQLGKLEAQHEGLLRMLRHARRQVQEQQCLVAEYRRRLAGADLAKRQRAPVVTQEVPALAEEVAQPLGPPGGWADTQPM